MRYYSMGMSMDEWRITQATIETEMLRLAALLSIPFRSAHPGVARHEVKASNVALEGAIKAVAQNLKDVAARLSPSNEGRNAAPPRRERAPKVISMLSTVTVQKPQARTRSVMRP
jgi:hypothetical protein